MGADAHLGAEEEKGEKLMYPHFIEVHYPNGIYDPALINIDNIVLVNSRHVYTTSDRGDECIPVMETYDELKALIEGCGCLVRTKDPRISDHPLTKQMILDEESVGQPVWNSNNGRWYIIANWSNHDDKLYMVLQGIWDILKFRDEDLLKYPLYRMKP